MRCLCELLLAMPHFNFHNNIIVILAPLMNDAAKKVRHAAFRSPLQVSDVCCVQVSDVCCVQVSDV